ncbi:LysR family transcriptional regulator [Arenibacterium halophilum]|uniref:LysR family transcriptional regulator n=1 Tax=Arenibacterium halophilum TaxID=2583821 RepID=A0ABY2XF84_9RHOB|nr:LysR family transcriptional regulator [Arenibacterium halophilum]TMV15318.1 LysR family transcriptional regulator [Arenibacterium halophilum]
MPTNPTDTSYTALPREALRAGNLTLHKLHVFCMVARYGSVTRAAQHLSVAQPAVSAHLRSLEQSLDTKLVRKSGRNIELTLPGQRIHAWAEEIIQRSSEMFLDLADIERGVIGKIRMAASMVAGSYKLSDVVIAFKKENPLVHISLSVATPHVATEAVLSGDSDFGVTLIDHSRDTSRLKTELLWREPLYLVAASHSRLVGPVARREDLASIPLVTPPKGQMAMASELIDEALRAVGVAGTNSVLAFGHPESILNAIRADIGAGFVYQSTLPDDLTGSGLRIVETPDVEIAMPLYLIYDRNIRLSPVEKQLLERIRAAYKELV